MRTLQVGLVLAGFWVAVLGARPAVAGDGLAAGRKHAAKANALAAKNKCKAAVVEFGKAYRLLKDATLLFNRAECYREMGQGGQALKDYEQFLADMPNAPNRKVVEGRIAALKSSAPARAEAAPPPEPAPALKPKPPAPGATAPATDTSTADPERAEKWVD